MTRAPLHDADSPGASGLRIAGGVLTVMIGSGVLAFVTLTANSERASALLRYGLALPLAASLLGQLLIVAGALTLMDGLRMALPHQPSRPRRHSVMTFSLTGGSSLASSLLVALISGF